MSIERKFNQMNTSIENNLKTKQKMGFAGFVTSLLAFGVVSGVYGNETAVSDNRPTRATLMATHQGAAARG